MTWHRPPISPPRWFVSSGCRRRWDRLATRRAVRCFSAVGPASCPAGHMRNRPRRRSTPRSRACCGTRSDGPRNCSSSTGTAWIASRPCLSSRKPSTAASSIGWPACPRRPRGRAAPRSRPTAAPAPRPAVSARPAAVIMGDGAAPGPRDTRSAGTGYDPSVITELGHDVFQIDTRMAGYHGITAGYLIRSAKPCLVETGAGPSAPVVRDALGALGVGAQDLATVVVTHIHLDNAGGTGDLSAMFPQAEVVVHERGARHLVDPSRLMKSARMVYGDELDELFGELAPTPAGRIRAVDETGSIDLGDAAGVYIPETADLRPATPPPDFDLETALASLRKFGALRPTRLLFSHFGPVGDVDQTLARSAEELRVWVEEVKQARGTGLDLDHAVAMVRDRTKQRYALFLPETDPEVAARFERLTGAASNVAGIMHWLDQSAGQG